MRSIGRTIAEKLAQLGCDIVLTGTGRAPDRYPDDEKAAGWRDIDSVAEEVTRSCRRALAVVSDVSDPGSVDALVESTIKEFGRIDFVVNNAGAARGDDRVPVVELAVEEWRKVIDVNLNGSFYMSRACGQRMIEQGEGGVIVNISSIAGKLLPPNTAAYAASKAAIQALTACMAQEVGRHKIRVNAVCPGIVDTYRMDDVPRGEIWDKLIESRIPIGRAGTGEDIASIVAFLCSEQGSWITGQSYNVDGGTAVAH